MATVLNVDLDVIAKRSLEPLVAAFGDRVDVLYVGRRGRKYAAHFEVAGSGWKARAEPLIRKFVRLVETLPPRERRLWDVAESREFNIGVETVVKGPAFELRLSRATLDVVSRVNGSVVVTVYAPERVIRVAGK